MAAVGRNQPCPCGSGQKVKRCCGIRPAPSEEDLARKFVTEQCEAVIPVLRRIISEPTDLIPLYMAVAELPALDLSCQLRLPPLLSPELERVRTALVNDDPEEVERALPSAIAQVDTAVARAELARAVIALRDAGRVDESVAAAALLDLDTAEALIREALLAALEVNGGVSRTPAGVILLG